MRNFCVAMVVLNMVIFACIYIRRLRQGLVEPAFSTWVVFTLGTSISLITFALAQDHDFVSGVLNATDVLAVSSIMLAAFLEQRKKIIGHGQLVHFQTFEKWYLAGVAIVVGYGLWSGDAWSSNLFSQVLVSSGFIPTVHKLLKEKRNTESFSAWLFNVAAGAFAIYPAATGGKSLAVVYAIRSMTLIIIVVGIMAYYQYRAKTTITNS